MKCCDRQNRVDKPEQAGDGAQMHHGGHHSHWRMMLLCCGIPLLLYLLLPLLGGAAALSGFRLVPLLCPLFMIVMVVMMLRAHKAKECSKHQPED